MIPFFSLPMFRVVIYWNGGLQSINYPGKQQWIVGPTERHLCQPERINMVSEVLFSRKMSGWPQPLLRWTCCS